MMSVLGGVVCFYSLFVPIHDFRDLAKTLLSEFQALDSCKAFVAFCSYAMVHTLPRRKEIFQSLPHIF